MLELLEQLCLIWLHFFSLSSHECLVSVMIDYKNIDSFICSVLSLGDLFYSMKCHSVTLGHICFHSIKHSLLFLSLLQPSLVSEKPVLFSFIHTFHSATMPHPEENLRGD